MKKRKPGRPLGATSSLPSVMVRIGTKQADALRKRARQEGRSMRWLVEQAVEKYLLS